MFNCHNAVVAGLIPCLAIAGCQSNKPPAAVSEYRPGVIAHERTAPESKVYVLALVLDPKSSELIPATQPAHGRIVVAEPRSVEVERVYAQQGSPLGFLQSNGQLIAVAGPTQKRLYDAHYTWHVLRRSHPGNPLTSPKAEDFLRTVGIVVAAGAMVAGVLFLIHDNRHSLLTDLLDPN